MSDFSLTLVLQIKTSKNHQWHGKGKHEIWENHSFWRNISCERAIFPFCGSSYRQSAGSEVYVIRLSKREIVGSLSSVYFCGGDCVEDVTSHLMPHLSLHPTLRTCSSDTILRGISELSCANTTYTSDTGKVYDFNTQCSLTIYVDNLSSYFYKRLTS